MKQKQAMENQGFNGVKGKPVQQRTAAPAQKEADWDHRDRHVGQKRTS